MSGKAKQANRTKNNVRPSSSGRSAELLSSKINPALVLVGPGNLMPALFPGLGGPTAEEPLGNEFLLCFKKFHKKDPITKIKALNELKELVAKSGQSEVVSALGSWAHYYPSLTVDIDRKVREATQSCHGAIVRTCGRQVALHLKRLLPAWLMAQHDEYAPVQRIAHDDLHATFPNNKLVEAIKFCKVDICNLYMDNLKGNAEYMLSGKKTDDEEERQAQVARVLSCTLRALRLLVATLPDDQSAWLWDTLLPLLCANSYWKLAGHASSAVRASFYMATGAVLRRFHAQLPPELAQRGARALLAPAERTPAVCAERWRALLLLALNVPDFLDLTDNKDLLFKRLWDVLENAAWGEARALADALPPLLRMVPADMRTERFYNKFFAALFVGLRQRTLLNDKSERELWGGIVASAVRHVEQEHRRDRFAVHVTSWALRTWLRTVLAAPAFPGKGALVASTAAHVADLLRGWILTVEGGGSPVPDRIVRNFWQNVGAAAADVLREPPADADDLVELTDAHVQFVIALQENFKSDEERDGSAGLVPTAGAGAGAEAAAGRCCRDLCGAAEALVGAVLDFAHRRRLVRSILPAALPLLKRFRSASTLRSLARTFEADSIFEFYEKIVKAWLVDEDQRCEAAVELVFLLLPHLELHEQNALYESFEELSPEAVRWCLARAPAEGAGACWLRSAAVARALLALAPPARTHELLLAVLARHRAGDVIVSDDVVSGVLRACTDALSAVEATAAAGEGRAASVRLSARLVRVLPESRAPATVPLLLALFRLTLHVPRSSAQLGAETWSEALGAWREGARRLPSGPRAAFVRDTLQLLHAHLFRDLERLDTERIDHVASLCPDLGGDAGDGAELKLLLAARPHREPPLEVFALQLGAVEGDLVCPLERDNEWTAAVAEREAVLDKETLVSHLYSMLFRATFVRCALLPAPALQNFRDQFCETLHDCAVLDALYDHYAFWKYYDIIREAKARMDDIVSDVLVRLPAGARCSLAAALRERSAARGYFWAYASRRYERARTGDVREAPGAPEHDNDKRESAPEAPKTEAGVAADEQELAAAADGDSERSDSRQSHSTSSFEILEASDGAPAEAPVARSLEKSQVELGDDRRTSPPGRAAKPVAGLATECEEAARYVDLLGEMMLRNGYFHEAQAKAAEAKKQKARAKAEFDRQQDAVLVEFEVNGRLQIFEKWVDEPAAYRRLGVELDEGALYAAKDFAMLRAYYCLYVTEAPHVDQLVADLAAETSRCNLDAVINGYYRHNQTMLFERSLQGASWLQLSATAAALDLLGEAVTSRGWDAPALHWDFTNIALCSVLSSLALSARMWATDAVRLALVARPALELYVRVRRFVGSVRRECTRRLPTAHVAALPREWADIFAPDATGNIWQLILHVLDASCGTVTAAQVAILRGLTEASQLLEPSVTTAALGRGRLTLERTVRTATRVLGDACHHGFKYLAYYTLRTLAPSMIEADERLMAARAGAGGAGVADADDDDDAVLAQLSLALYGGPLARLQALVDAALDGYVVCDDICEVAPHSDSHSVVLGYLLLCAAVHRQCELATGDLAMHYGTVFNERANVEGMLSATLRLLPPGAAHYMAASLPALPRRLLPWFIRLRDFDLREPCSGESVSRLACGVLLRVLGGPGGAAARGWWAVQRARESAALARLVAAAVAPPLVNHQLAEVQARARELGPDAKVTVCWSTRSAAVALHGEEGKSPALRVTLGAAHPLNAPRVHSAQAGPHERWVARYLGYRNGRLIDALQLWVRAVTAALQEGAHCYVCYCRAHPLDGSAPTVSCPQCRNAFHSRCIRRWFRTSNRSNCPVCRTNF